jgi:gamma-glutamyltranspeptidase
MVVSNSRQASEAGVEILRAGGNAVDAAVAVGFALAVTWPEAGNIGGGGFMLTRMADGRTSAVDYREMGPMAASRDMYLDANGPGCRRGDGAGAARARDDDVGAGPRAGDSAGARRLRR